MLDIFGTSNRFCDGVSRRNFLKIGGLAMGGLSLPDILRAEAATSGVASTGGLLNPSQAGLGRKGIIMIFLPGGPPHQDMFDLKPEAPAEIRGEFKPISTNVSGIEICELFPQVAGMMDKFATIRTIVGSDGSHSSYWCNSGWNRRGGAPQGGHPAVGSVLSKLAGPVDRAVPPFVGLAPTMGHMPWADAGDPGFLGLAHAPFKPDGEGMKNMALNGITLDRLDDRKAVLTSLDRMRRDTDASGALDGIDAFTQQAFNVLTSSKLLDALDVEKEDPKLRDRYGRGSMDRVDDGGPKCLDHFLVARRLIEAGVRCVTLAFARWDWHGNNFGQGRAYMPMLDQALSALVEDLDNRGMLDDVSIVVWGEFGRTPRINSSAGRDHWPQVSCALLAGGGMRTGQVIGETNRLGEVPKDRPIHFQEVFSTLYRQLGIDVERTTIPDHAGRPQYLVEHRDLVPELI
ncbi:MAG: DUF1501 domain-containing protein [Planctomycetales bacterium]|nr:DUF1501 domain-containing protein [Planctomycetales bacterium]